MADEKAEKIKAIDLALSQIEKQFGKGSIMRLGNKEAIVPIAVISTGSISFDAALGIGGAPPGPLGRTFWPGAGRQHPIRLPVGAGRPEARAVGASSTGASAS